MALQYEILKNNVPKITGENYRVKLQAQETEQEAIDKAEKYIESIHAPLRSQLKKQVSELRDEYRDRGIEIDGVKWYTDDKSVKDLTSKAIGQVLEAMREGKEYDQITFNKWKTKSGFVEDLTLDRAVAIARKIELFIQTCYNIEGDFETNVIDGDDPFSVDVDEYVSQLDTYFSENKDTLGFEVLESQEEFI